MTAYQKAPCDDCPWRTDAPPGQFPAERYEALQATHGTPGHEAPLGAPLFACHKTAEGREAICAGFLAVEGYDHLTVRLMVISGRVPGASLTPATGWPTLYANYGEMVAAQEYPAPEDTPE